MKPGSELEQSGNPAIDGNGARIRRAEAGHKTEQSAFAGAVGPDYTHGFARCDLERNISQRDKPLTAPWAQQARYIITRERPPGIHRKGLGYGVKFNRIHGSE